LTLVVVEVVVDVDVEEATELALKLRMLNLLSMLVDEEEVEAVVDVDEVA
jgi:hypothetical protein